MATLTDALSTSGALPGFVDDVRRFLNDGRPTERLRFNRGAPRIKVERVLTQLLTSHPDLPIRSVSIDGESGCEYFRGSVTAETEEGARRWTFHWDCRWKARQEGWTDAFGLPDQIRAARTFGYDCFRTWDEADEAA